MAIERILLDPNAVYLSEDDVVAKINAATANIDRAGSVEAAARPLVDAEVTAPKLSSDAAKLNLDAIEELEREYIKTNPQAGEYKVTGVQVDSDGKLAVDKSDTAEVE